MMIDPIVSLAFAMQSNKGVFALLLGSGVSREAQIPTGWEVVLELIRRLGKAQDEDVGDDPAAWYLEKYGHEPDYSDLQEKICGKQEERQQLLRQFFEPSSDERKQGLKSPTKAHKAIAKLVANGMVRVIVTTNFDRLIEQAIEQERITPVVLSTEDAMKGAIPLMHQQICVIKVHGDYLDPRIKNTQRELETYGRNSCRLLKQIFDNYGLVVCGWSAQWDGALRGCIEQVKSRRYSTYWVSVGECTDAATRLIKHRDGVVIKTDGAESFFTKLEQCVTSLEIVHREHPVTVDALTAMTKRMLTDPKERISLEDLVHDETEAARRRVIEVLKQRKTRPDVEDGTNILERLGASVERLQAVLICGAAWGKAAHRKLWVQSISRLAIPGTELGGTFVRGLWMYPAMYLTYSAGLAAIAHGRWRTLRAVICDTQLREHGKASPLLLSRWKGDLYGCAPRMLEVRMKEPVSEMLFNNLRHALSRHLPDNDEYDRIFDMFEVSLTLSYLDIYAPKGDERSIFPPSGRFSWKIKEPPGLVLNGLMDFEQRIHAGDGEWAPLRAGLFGGTPARANELLEKAYTYL